jgi:hypothetical protein
MGAYRAGEMIKSIERLRGGQSLKDYINNRASSFSSNSARSEIAQNDMPA